MGFETIHETVVADIFETIRDGVEIVGDTVIPKSAKIRMSNSITRATSGLTLVFPVICINTLPIEVATMVAKAIERKNVALLQMAFSAYNITNAPDAISHLAKFHTNLNLDKMDLDKFMDLMETLDESGLIDSSVSRAITEDCKRNINYVMEDDINESSVMRFSEVNKFGKPMIVQEAPEYPTPQTRRIDGSYRDLTSREIANNVKNPYDRYYDSVEKDADRRARQDIANQQRDTADADRRSRESIASADRKSRKDIAAADRAARSDENEKDRSSRERMAKKDRDLKKDELRQRASDQYRQYLSNQLLDTDVKKANEMQPTLMVVNFYVNDKDRQLNIAQQAVAGVKSKLYPVDANDVINKILAKHADSDVMLKLVKVSTRETSFVKDFLLGIDDAKIDSLSKSRKGSANRIFKALERRALKGKIRKSLRMENNAKAISTLVVSTEIADDLLKYENVDILQPKSIIPIMEKLNLLYFVVVDTTSESIQILADGDGEFETYSFTALDRENNMNYKQIVNLMAKVR